MAKNTDVSIQFIRHDLGYGVFVFKPVGVLEGNYDKELETFETNFGEMYESIKHPYEEGAGYFYAAFNIKELEEMYKEGDKDVLLSTYYDDFLNYIYIGLEGEVDVDIMAINIDSIGEFFTKKENSLEVYGNTDEQDYYWFTEEGIMDLMSLDDIKEVRKRLSNLIQSKPIDINEYEELEDYEPKHTREKNLMKVQREESKKLKLSELKKEVLSNIIGQDNAVNSVATTMIVNENSKNPRHKSHILIAGPSGTGKTEMMNIISKKMNKPVFKADSTAYTEEGYVGKSVYSMLKGLIEISNNDLNKAQNGILIIDEIDKKVSKDGKNDVSGTAVLNSLLKIMDRDVIEVDVSREKTVNFDTSNLTIVFMGAFSDLYEKKKKDQEEKEKKEKEKLEDKKITIGFTAVQEEKKEEKEEKKDKSITKQDLIDYGVPPEFLGRISNITYTKDLDEADLIQILKKSKISPLKLEQEFFEDMGIEFKYTNGYIKQLAQNCLKRKTGARELKSEVQKSLEKVYEEVLDNPGKVKTLKLTKKTALNNKEYCIQ